MKENSNGTDTNVGTIGNSIEEDIKIINNFITYFNKNIQNGNKADLTVLGEEINALEHILSAYKRVLKENEELAEKNEAIRRYNFETITIKKIKDKIEKYKNILKTCNKAKDIDRIKAINEKILELQELIEKER